VSDEYDILSCLHHNRICSIFLQNRFESYHKSKLYLSLNRINILVLDLFTYKYNFDLQLKMELAEFLDKILKEYHFNRHIEYKRE